MAKVISLNYNMGVFRGQAFREEMVDGVFRGVAEVDDEKALAWFRARPDAFRIEDEPEDDFEDEEEAEKPIPRRRRRR